MPKLYRVFWVLVMVTSLIVGVVGPTMTSTSLAFNDTEVSASTKNPNSVADYKKLGYKNIKYLNWSGNKKVISTKTKRLGGLGLDAVLDAVPVAGWAGKIYKAGMLGKGFLDASKTIKTPDVWPTVNLRNIQAKTPRGYTTIIGQEIIVKLYTNSKRTKLYKTYTMTVWVG